MIKSSSVWTTTTDSSGSRNRAAAHFLRDSILTFYRPVEVVLFIWTFRELFQEGKNLACNLPDLELCRRWLHKIEKATVKTHVSSVRAPLH